MRLRPALALLPLLILSACETGPRERVVDARFACEDGREVRATFNLDARTAALRIGKKEQALLEGEAGVAGRAYGGAGYSLRGVGDRITLTTPGQAPVSCLETR